MEFIWASSLSSSVLLVCFESVFWLCWRTRILPLNTAVLWPAFAGLAILAGLLIRVVYGSQWAAAALPLAMLCIASMILVSTIMTWEMFVVCGETGRQARFEAIRSGVGLLCFLGGCLLSVTGAAASRIEEAVVSTLIYRPHLERMTQTVRGEFGPVYRRSLLLTLVATAPAGLLMAVQLGSVDTPPGYVAATVVAGVGAWVLALRWLRHPVLAELMKAASLGRGMAVRKPATHAGTW